MSGNAQKQGVLEPETGAEIPPAAGEAALIFRRLSEGQGEDAAGILADAVAAAHEVGAGSWALTVARRDGSVRFTAGRWAVLTVEEGRLTLTLESAAIPPDGLSEVAWQEPLGENPIRSLPGVRVLAAPTEVVLKAYRRLRAAFLAAVTAAAAECPVSPHGRLHEAALVAELERVLGRKLPRPEYPRRRPTLGDRLLELMEEVYPGWLGAYDPRFVEDEIAYKRETVRKAAELLEKDVLTELIRERRFDEVIRRLDTVGKDNNLLYRGVPAAGDLGILLQEDLDREAFSRAILDLLHGEGDAADRLDAYGRFVEGRGLPHKWTFPTYFLFVLHPERELFIKPETIKRFLEIAGSQVDLGTKPSGQVYGAVRDLARRAMEELEAYGLSDMIDVQSVIWCCARAAKERAGRLLTPEKRDEFARLFEEFCATYCASPAGREHKEAIIRSRREFGENLEEIRRLRSEGRDVTDLVLRKLLPHADTSSTRERGCWIHPAPVVTKDLKRWFEGAGWVKSSDWSRIAREILRFFEECSRGKKALEAACADFLDAVPAKGLQAGILSPGLNSLRPDDFFMVNSKSVSVVHYFTGRKLTSALAEYPKANETIASVVGELEIVLRTCPELAVLPPGDGFDMFCHWLKAVKNHPFHGVGHWKVPLGAGGEAWEQCVRDGFIALGWSAAGDLSGLSRAAFDQMAARLLTEHEDWSARDMEQLWKFARHIQEGDRIVATRGAGEVLGMGTVTGPYFFVEGTAFGHRIPVEWEDTSPRTVNKPGWNRTVIKLTREDFEDVAGSPPVSSAGGRSGAGMVPDSQGDPSEASPDRKPLLTRRTFELLELLHQNPRVEVYERHREEFLEFLEEPFKRLFAGIARRLPRPMLEVLETRRGILSRIRKNDWGRGGAWDHFWGAFYPKGGRRVTDPQLFVDVDHENLRFGFHLGDDSAEAHDHFLANASRYRDTLVSYLSGAMQGLDVVYGDEGDAPGRQGARDPRSWLQDPAGPTIRVRCLWPSERVVAVPAKELSDVVAHFFELVFPLFLMAIPEIPAQEFLALLDPLAAEATVDLEEQEEYTIAECASDLCMDEETIRGWLRALEAKKQAILYGPPGAGKTFVAEHLARHLVGGGDGIVELVQFHPAYAYEDFIQGLRPHARPDGTLEYRLVAGRFLEFCREAASRQGISVMIVDEINRANLARVFGELMYLLEYRDREIPLAGGGTLRIPENVRLIGTMNTADRSIALVDFALRRRFAFLPLYPDPEVLRRYHRTEETGCDVEGLVKVLETVNGAIGDRNYQIGISFFLRRDLRDTIPDIWRTEIEPYLEEYFFDRPETVEEYRWDKVGAAILGDQ